MTAGPLAALILVTGVFAQESVSDALRTIEGERLTGSLQSISTDGKVLLRLTAGEQRELDLEGLQRIDFGTSARGEPGFDALWLRSGQALPATFQAAESNGGVFVWPLAKDPLKLPWRYLRAVKFARSDGLDPGFAASLQEPSRSRDLLYAQQGDDIRRLSVEFLGVEDGKVVVRFAGEEQTLSLERVYGIVFGDHSGARADPLPNPRVSAVLSGGRRIAGKLAAVDRTRCRIKLDEGVELDLPREALKRIEVRSDRLVLLSELEPKVEQTPALDRSWPPLWNQGPSGDKIQLGDQTYARGVVLVPLTRLIYRIDGRFDVFEATIGLERRAGPSAHAVFRIKADGQVLFDSGPVTPDSDPRSVAVPVTDVQRLTLEADFGDNLDLGDLCVFANPRLVKK